MPYIDDADVQVHLPVDSVKVEEIPDDRAVAFEDAHRIVRGYLAGVIEPATLVLWTTPELTPVQVRAVAGRFAAAKIYRLRFGQSSMKDPEYAQNLYKEAMAMINAILSGALALDGVVFGADFDSAWFEPNDASAPPVFTMDAQF